MWRAKNQRKKKARKRSSLAGFLYLRKRSRVGSLCIGLLYFVIGQMFIRLRELNQFRLIIDVWIRHFEAADFFDMVGLDLFDTINLFQDAPDRGGTSSSHHVGHFERDQCELDGIHA